jgi:hypothetical protein
MSGHPTSLRIVDGQCGHRSHLCLFDIEEASSIVRRWRLAVKEKSLLDVMGSSVDDREQEHGVRRLPVEPLTLIEGQKGDLRPQNSDDITAHGQQDEASVECQNQTSAARNPHRVLQSVQRG